MKLTTFSFLASLAASSLYAAEPPAPKFRAVEIDNKVEIGYGLAIADVDGDGKKDILLADKNLIVWHQNPTWKKHVIAEKLTARDHVCIAAADIDGDGKAEVAAGAEWNPGDTVNSGSVHYLIAPADRTQKWEAVKLPHEPTVHRMRWVKNFEGKHELVVVPLHGKGNKNGEGEGVRILSYQVPEDPRGTWRTTLVNNAYHLTHNFDPTQWDADEGQELLLASKEGVFLLDRVGQGMQATQIGGNKPGETAFVGAGEVRSGKLPGGKRFVATVEPMHGNNAVVYVAGAEGSSRKLWTRQVLDANLADGHAVACGDFLKAGSDQIVVGWRAMNRPGVKVGVKMFVPLDAEGKQWREHLLDDNTMACEDLAVADLNDDGLPDIIAAGRATKNLKVYFNETGK